VATWFGITTPVTEQTLPADTRVGKQLHTVTNESGVLIRGDAIVVPEGDTRVEWFNIVNASRAYSVDGTEQVTLDIKVPDDVGAGTYSYRFRVVVGGGVPEEQFNDGPVSRITVLPKIVVAAKPFPWWIVAVVGAIVLALIVGGIVVKACGGTPTPTATPVPTAPPTPVPTPPPTPVQLADLTVTVRSRHGGLSDLVPLFIVVTNEGTGKAGNFTVLVQAEGQADLSYTVFGLGPGQADEKNLTLTVDPFSQGTGVVNVDPFNNVDETDDSNNSAPFEW
jgi:hypothetical protein